MEEYTDQKANLINQIQLENTMEENYSCYLMCFKELHFIAFWEKKTHTHTHFEFLHIFLQNAVAHLSVPTYTLGFSLWQLKLCHSTDNSCDRELQGKFQLTALQSTNGTDFLTHTKKFISKSKKCFSSQNVSSLHSPLLLLVK